MLGLADEIGGDVHRVGGVVGQNRDLGRACFGVDPTCERQIRFAAVT